MAVTADRAPAPVWRPRKRLWGLFAAFVAGSVVLGAMSEWR